MSTCPADYATSVPTEKINSSMNLENVLGESLQQYGIKRHLPFANRSGSTMNVNFEVTVTKRAILSVHKGCGNGSMVVFTPDRKGRIVNDQNCIEQLKQIMASTPGFHIVYDREAYVLDVDVNDGGQKPENNSAIVFPVIRSQHWERALTQAQHEHVRKRATHQDVHGENQTHLSRSRSRYLQNLTSLRQRSVNPTKPYIVLFVPATRFASRPKAQTEDTRNSW